jgi:hypothetical protein
MSVIRAITPASFVAIAFAAATAAGQVSEPSDRVVTAQAPIVEGNAVNAKKRALADAFRQAVERAWGELLKEGPVLPQPMPPAVAQLKASFANSAQRFVRSYRLIEQTTEGGLLRVLVETDVDTALLRRELDRARGGTGSALPTLPRPVVTVFLVGGTAPVAANLTAGLTAAGVVSHLDPAQNEAQLLANAAKQNSPAIFVVASSTSEGVVRGAGRVSMKCSLRSRVFALPVQPGRPWVDRADDERGFGADETQARTACFERATAATVRSLVGALHSPTVASPFVTLMLDIADSAVIPPLLQALKRMGGVNATEVRHVAATMAELRVFTRNASAVLMQSLVRETTGKLSLTSTQASIDQLALRVRPIETSPSEEARP